MMSIDCLAVHLCNFVFFDFLSLVPMAQYFLHLSTSSTTSMLICRSRRQNVFRSKPRGTTWLLVAPSGAMNMPSSRRCWMQLKRKTFNVLCALMNFLPLSVPWLGFQIISDIVFVPVTNFCLKKGWNTSHGVMDVWVKSKERCWQLVRICSAWAVPTPWSGLFREWVKSPHSTSFFHIQHLKKTWSPVITIWAAWKFEASNQGCIATRVLTLETIYKGVQPHDINHNFVLKDSSLGHFSL